MAQSQPILVTTRLRAGVAVAHRIRPSAGSSRRIDQRQYTSGMAVTGGFSAPRSATRGHQCFLLCLHVVACILVYSWHSGARVRCLRGMVRKHSAVAAGDFAAQMGYRNQVRRCGRTGNCADCSRITADPSLSDDSASYKCAAAINARITEVSEVINKRMIYCRGIEARWWRGHRGASGRLGSIARPLIQGGTLVVSTAERAT